MAELKDNTKMHAQIHLLGNIQRLGQHGVRSAAQEVVQIALQDIASQTNHNATVAGLPHQGSRFRAVHRYSVAPLKYRMGKSSMVCAYVSA